MLRTKLILLAIVAIASILRLVNLDSNPPSMYWDEVGMGYNAYSILQTGLDEHARPLPLDYFLSFRDYKPPLYIYAVVPFIFALGLNEWAVRLPSALAGTFSVLLTYLFVKELFARTQSKINYHSVALGAAFLMAVSPWSIQLSRAAYEANLGQMLTLAGALLFMRWVNTQQTPYLLLSGISFAFTFYTFNSNRVFTPLLVSLLCLIYYKTIFVRLIHQPLRHIAIAVFCVSLVLPLIPHLTSQQGQLRYQEVNIFSDSTLLITSQQRIDRAGDTVIANLFNNRRIAYAQQWLSGYFAHFRGDFLFIKGDVNPRFSTGDIGQLYLISLPFLLIGCYVATIRLGRPGWLILGWLLLAPVPSAFAREVPHALRTLHILPTFDILTSLGLVGAFVHTKNYLTIKSPKLQTLGLASFVFVVSTLLAFQFFYFVYNYQVHYPRESAGEWQYGYKQMVQELIKIEQNYEKVIITDYKGRPYINLLFHGAIPPQIFHQTRRYKYDELGLFEVNGFDKYHFRGIDWLREITSVSSNQKVLVVGAPSELKIGKWTKSYVKDLKGDPVFILNEIPQNEDNSTEQDVFRDLDAYNLYHNTNYTLDRDNRWVDPNIWATMPN